MCNEVLAGGSVIGCTTNICKHTQDIKNTEKWFFWLLFVEYQPWHCQSAAVVCLNLSRTVHSFEIFISFYHFFFVSTVELQQAYEVDSLEYLEALETMTDRLETRVNFCKAHLMMITCFDVSSKHR